MLNKSQKALDNSLYKQLQKDLKKKKNKNRLYVPVELFSNIESINISKDNTKAKRKFLSFVELVIK